MSGETEEAVSAFTVDSLHVHIMTLINERDKRYEQRFQSQEKAIAEKDAATNARLTVMNEFRGSVEDLTASNVTRNELSAIQQRNDDKFTDMQRRLDKAEGGRAALIAALVIAVTVLGVIITFANYVTN